MFVVCITHTWKCKTRLTSRTVTNGCSALTIWYFPKLKSALNALFILIHLRDSSSISCPQLLYCMKSFPFVWVRVRWRYTCPPTMFVFSKSPASDTRMRQKITTPTLDASNRLVLNSASFYQITAALQSSMSQPSFQLSFLAKVAFHVLFQHSCLTFYSICEIL